MHNLNLYSYYDKSLADINKAHLEIAQRKSKNETGPSKRVKITVPLIFMLVIGVVIAGYMGFFREEAVVYTPPPAPPPDLRSEEEKQGYVQIQIFEFADEPAEQPKEFAAAAENNIEKDKNTEDAQVRNIAANTENLKTSDIEKLPAIRSSDTAKPDNKKETAENKPAAVKKPADTAAKPAVIIKEYSVLFENIDDKQYERVKALSGASDMNMNVVDAYSNTYSVWKVYETDDSGDILIGDKRAVHREDFLTKDDAAAYAAKENINAIIRQVGITDKTYTVKFCCGDIEKAKNLAQNSGITDRVIKIVREK